MKIHKELIDIKILFTIVAFIATLCYSCYSVYFLNHTYIYEENELLENIQVATLIISCLIFFFSIFSQEREDKLILVFIFFLCFSFVLREVDVEYLNIPSMLKFVGYGVGRNLMLASGFIMIFIYAVINHTYYSKLAKSFIVSINGILMTTAGILLYIGDFFEHNNSILHHVFLEEIFELSSYVLILLSALVLSKNKLRLLHNL